MFEAGGLLTFCHEAKEAGSSIERSAVERVVRFISGAEAAQGWTRPSLGFKPFVPGGDSVGAAYRRQMARSP